MLSDRSSLAYITHTWDNVYSSRKWNNVLTFVVAAVYVKRPCIPSSTVCQEFHFYSTMGAVLGRGT